jgi:hypothetical protein
MIPFFTLSSRRRSKTKSSVSVFRRLNSPWTERLQQFPYALYAGTKRVLRMCRIEPNSNWASSIEYEDRKKKTKGIDLRVLMTGRGLVVASEGKRWSSIGRKIRRQSAPGRLRPVLGSWCEG